LKKDRKKKKTQADKKDAGSLSQAPALLRRGELKKRGGSWKDITRGGIKELVQTSKNVRADEGFCFIPS